MEVPSASGHPWGISQRGGYENTKRWLQGLLSAILSGALESRGSTWRDDAAKWTQKGDHSVRAGKGIVK